MTRLHHRASYRTPGHSRSESGRPSYCRAKSKTEVSPIAPPQFGRYCLRPCQPTVYVVCNRQCIHCQQTVYVLYWVDQTKEILYLFPLNFSPVFSCYLLFSLFSPFSLFSLFSLFLLFSLVLSCSLLFSLSFFISLSLSLSLSLSIRVKPNGSTSPGSDPFRCLLSLRIRPAKYPECPDPSSSSGARSGPTHIGAHWPAPQRANGPVAPYYHFTR